MTRSRRFMLSACFSLAVLVPLVALAQQAAPAPSLYKRVGGYDAIAAVVDDFLGGLAADPKLARFFVGVNAAHLKEIRQLAVDMVCEATGGPCFYTGRDMKSTHAGLGVTEADWNSSVQHFVATLDKFKVPQKEKDELVAIVGSLKNDIVEKP